MKELTIEEIRSYQIKILSDVDAFCRKNKIRYSLAGGTMLGAVRHHGYIPWDDDIDLMMPRPDYNRFLKEYSKDCQKCFEVGHSTINPKYAYIYAKIYAAETVLYEESQKEPTKIYIDIFPFDGVKDSLRMRINYFLQKRLFFILIGKSYSLSSSKSLPQYLWRSLRFFCSLFFSSAWVHRMIEQMMQYYDFEKESYCVSLSTMRSWKIKQLQRSVFDEYIELPFENIKCQAISKYKEYLTIEYGDFMQLPPIEKRVRAHCFKAYQKNISTK